MIRRYKIGNGIIEVKPGEKGRTLWRYRDGGITSLDKQWTLYDLKWHEGMKLEELTKLENLLLGLEDDEDV